MAFTYTPQDVRKELVSDPQHGAMFDFVLKEFDKRHFSLKVEGLGFFALKWKASASGIIIDSGAQDIRTAAAWARNGFREWAGLGIRDPNIYFAEIARAWAQSQATSCTQCLGSTVDFLFLFSSAATTAQTNRMYQISSSINRDLKGILLWVFVGWWEVGLSQGLDSTPVHADQSDLHPDYHDSQPGLYDEDQTHHFALYFYVGVKVGSSKVLLYPVLKRTHDIDDNGNIINAGDYYLGLTAARLGDDFDDHPRFIGAEIARALQNPSPEKQQDKLHEPEDDESEAQLWIVPDGRVIHPNSPAGGGGPGRFTSTGVLSFVPEPGELPHPNSPAARTLGPLATDRDASERSFRNT
jgi:hypothetical protein